MFLCLYFLIYKIISKNIILLFYFFYINNFQKFWSAARCSCIGWVVLFQALRRHRQGGIFMCHLPIIFSQENRISANIEGK